MPRFILIHSTVWPQYMHQRHRQTDRQDRQRSDSIGRTVLQTVAQKLATGHCESTRHRASTRTRGNIAFGAMLSQQRNQCTDCKSAEQSTTDGTRYHSPSYIRVRAVVWECSEAQTHRQTHRRPWPLYISRCLRLMRNVKMCHYTLACVVDHTDECKKAIHSQWLQEAQLSLRDRATRACQLKSGKVLHKCRRLVFEKL